MSNHTVGLGTIIVLKESLLESTLAIGDPDGLLRVIRLEHVSPLHLHGDYKVWRWVGVWLPRLAKLDVAGHDEEWVVLWLETETVEMGLEN